MSIFNEFPYTNFHDMNLDWIIAKVKELAEEWARYYTEWNNWKDSMIDDWDEYQNNLNAAWKSMQDYINNYFDNLDVQDEINNKIGDMIDQGAFQAIIQPYIPPQVSAWLAANITQPTAPVIDTSLTVSGAAADAKSTGDKIRNLTHQTQRGLYFISEGKEIYVGYDWEVGTITNGADVVTAVEYRTKGFYSTADMDYIECFNSNEIGAISYYTSNYAFANVETQFNPTVGMKQEIRKDYPYYRIVFTRADYSKLPNLDDLLVYKIAPFQEQLDDIDYIEAEVAKIKDATVMLINNETSLTFSITNNSSISLEGDVITGGQDGWDTSGLIDISAYNKLIITAGSGYNHLLYAFYDKNEIFISGLNSGLEVLNITNEDVEIPDGAKYVRLAKNANAQMSIIGVKVIYENSAGAGGDNWNGKKWTVVGDSLTEINARTTKRYWNYIADETGIDVHCEAVGGTGYYADKENNRAFFQRILNVPTDSDVVTILGSANDGNYMSELGTATDTGTNTIGGCINTTIDNLYSIMPTVQLGIISPAPIIGANPYTRPYFNEYVKLLEEICKMRSIPFLNLYYESNLRPWDETFRQLAYTKDDGNGVHPDELGHKIFAPRIKGFLETLLL